MTASRLRMTTPRKHSLKLAQPSGLDDESFVKQCQDYTTFRSPEGAPYEFLVEIAPEHALSESAIRFNVTGQDPQTREIKTGTYCLQKRQHKNFLDLFAGIARDFRIRVPINRLPQPAPTFRVQYTPLLTENLSPDILYGYGDPAALKVEAYRMGNVNAWYYVVSTSNDAPNSFPIIRSRDLHSWEHRGFIFPRGHQPGWAAVGENVADYWAPEIHEVNNEFRAYFGARHKDTRELCIGVAKSNYPEGPYIGSSEPLFRGARIDPHLFVESDSVAYLYWKEDRNGIWPSLLNEFIFDFPATIRRMFDSEDDCRTASLLAALWPWTRELEPMECFYVQQVLIEAAIANFPGFEEHLRRLAQSDAADTIKNRVNAILDHLKTPFYAQLLSPDGLHVVGEPMKVLENDQLWEAHVIEGMWVIKREKKYYMFYAGNDFSTAEYGIGVALSDSPLGPFHKATEPFLRSTVSWSAPGHPTLVVGPKGEDILFLHGSFPGRTGYKQFRALLSIVLDFKGRFPLPS
jgi:arabinan endo-1,5-alpha-L-arabinosidase